MYSKLFRHVLYPAYETGLRRRKTFQYLKELEANQWKPVDELKAYQWQELKLLLNHAYEQSPYYKKLFQSIDLHPNDINTPADFRAIPICSREEVVKHSKEMVALNMKDQVIPKTTGGSTGVPVHFFIDRKTYEFRNAAAFRGYEWAGLEPGQPAVWIWGVDVGKPSRFARFKKSIYTGLYNRKMFNCFNWTEAEMRKCLEYINTRKPNGIVSFTTAVYNFAQYIESAGLECEGIPAIITGAEKLYPHQRELLERVFHTRVFNTYGCREFTLIGAECDKHEGLHTTIDNLYIEILKDGEPAKPGESGDIVITDLHNFGMPFLRYKNGDVAVQSDHVCSCGRGLPLIHDIDGRKMDEIISCDGTVVSGGFFPHLMKEFEQIAKYQVIQKARDEIRIKIVQKSELPATRLDFCRGEIQKVMGEGMRVEFDFVEDIPLTMTGKFRLTVSEVPR